jgi:hypothetical protein
MGRNRPTTPTGPGDPLAELVKGMVEHKGANGFVYYTKPGEPGWAYVPIYGGPGNEFGVKLSKMPIQYAILLAAGSTTSTGAGTRQRDPSGGQQGRELNIAALGGRVPVVYGQASVGGAIVMAATSSNVLTVAWGLGEGECESVENWYVDDKPVIGGSFGSFVDYNFHPGFALPNEPDPFLVAAAGESAATFERFPRLCYLVGRFVYSDRYVTGLPVPRFVVKGRKVYDPRSGNIAWTSNPALCVADYITARFGLAYPWSAIDEDSLEDAADYCDDLVSGKPRFTFNLALTSEQAHRDIVRLICDHFRGDVVERDGKFVFVVDKPKTSVYAFDATNSHLTTIRREGGSGIPNRVVVRWIDAANDYEQHEAIDETSGVRAGTETPQTAEYSLPGCTDAAEAQRAASYFLRKRLMNLAATIVATNAGAVALEPGDLVDRDGQDWVIRRIVRGDGNELTLDCEGYDADVYDPTSRLEDVKPTLDLPDPFDTPPDPSGLVVIEEPYVQQGGRYSSRLKVTWTKASTPFYGGTEIAVTRSTGTKFVLGVYDDGPAYVESCDDLATYNVTATTIARISGARSGGVTEIVTTTGKPDRPGRCGQINATVHEDGRVDLSWTTATIDDPVAYELRYVSASVQAACWEDAEFLDQTRSTSATVWLPPSITDYTGSWRIYVKAIDAAKQYSSEAVYCTVSIPCPTTPTVQTISWPLAGLIPDPDCLEAALIDNDTTLYMDGAESGVFRMYLARTISPQTIDDEIAAAGLASVQEWVDDVDDARNHGLGLWAPITAGATGTANWMGSYSYGSSFRRLNYRVWARAGTSRSIRRGRGGWEPTPDAIGKAEWGIYVSPGPGGRFGAWNTGPSGLTSQWVVRLSSNSSWAQRAIEAGRDGALAHYVYWRTPVVVYSGVVTTDGSGVATVTFAALADAFCLPTAELTVLNASTAIIATVTARTSSSISIKTWTTGGAASASKDVKVVIYDGGDGGTLGSGSP